MAPRTTKDSAPVATASGRGVSGGSWERSCSQAKKRTKARRFWRDVVADGSAQHGIARLERVEDGALGNRTCNLELHLAFDLRQFLKMEGSATRTMCSGNPNSQNPGIG